MKSGPLTSGARIGAGLVLLACLPFAAAESASTAWEERYERAEWISRVRIESVGSLINTSLSRAHMVAVEGYRYHASVLSGWKGSQGGTIRFRVDISDCHQTLGVDREYVLFGNSDHRGELELHSCDDLVPVEEADEVISYLDRVSAQQVVGQAAG